MKVRSLRNFYWKDAVREKMILLKKGDLFDVDPDKDATEIYLSLQSYSIEIVDEDFVPGQARYIGLRSFFEERVDGSRLKVVPGQAISLNQSDAGKLLIGNYVKPERGAQWIPARLIIGDVSRAPAKKMFDELEPSKENWAKEYGHSQRR